MVRLTGAEREIADLVARGDTNREVAERLGLSPKTVEWNLTKVYRKLGVRSRTELAVQRSPRRARAGGATSASARAGVEP